VIQISVIKSYYVNYQMWKEFNPNLGSSVQRRIYASFRRYGFY